MQSNFVYYADCILYFPVSFPFALPLRRSAMASNLEHAGRQHQYQHQHQQQHQRQRQHRHHQQRQKDRGYAERATRRPRINARRRPSMAPDRTNRSDCDPCCPRRGGPDQSRRGGGRRGTRFPMQEACALHWKQRINAAQTQHRVSLAQP